MADFNGRIGQIVRAFQQNTPGDAETRFVLRRALQAERKEAWGDGYREGSHDQWEANRLERDREGTTVGPSLDQDGRHPEGDYSLWHLAVYIPDGSDTDFCELLAREGIEIYRMWPVENYPQVKAAWDECQASLKAGKDSTDG